MPYTHATLLNAVNTLSARLYGSALYSSAELQACIIESLRTWNSYTSFWRAEFVFDLTLDTWWYDLTAPGTSLRPQTVTDFDLITQLNYHLLEPNIPAYPLVWAGSTQFALTDILSALQRRRDEVLAITGCHLTRSTVPAVVGRIFLDDSTIDIRRLAWLPTSGFGYSNKTVRPGDVFAKQSFDFNYTTAPQRPPQVYLQSTQPPLSFDVDCILPATGMYEVLTVNSGLPLFAAASTVLGIPDDWSWVVKFGAMADLLSRESNAKDQLRASYCEKRYREGVALLSVAPSLLSLRINNIPLPIDSVRNGDDFNPLWQALAHSTPKSAYTAGLNLVGFGPMPDSSTAYSITASVVSNAPVPSVLGDFIQLSHEDYDAVIDYAQHLSCLKLGGQEFLATIPLYSRFIKQAMLYNSKLSSFGQYQKPIYDIGRLNEERAPRFEGVTPMEQANAQ